ncbi:unnamed protein product [Mytilus edulis]|uniref:Uncharacterized protein n=1 Tax=Mytilus edulis TaxID=6550 RepID=A0A8S3U2N3_MYTED|nr:unnamed protein product [Mytilus edulis]
MQRLLHMIFVLTMIGTIDVKCQNPDDTWWDILKTQGVAFKNDTCRRNDKTCECYLTIEHRLTMMDEKEMILLVPSGGRFRPFNDLNREYSQEEEEEFIAADGYGSHQRSAGLYGPLVIIPLSTLNISTPQDDNNGKVHTVTIQDWNHFDDPETLYQRMMFGTFDLQENKQIDTTSDISSAYFTRFHCHSGIINGKGRFYNSLTAHNQAPLTTYDVEPNTYYRFRVIGAATLYPFRVYIQGHESIRIVASDGFEIEPIEVDSLIIHLGERIDFILKTDQVSGNNLLVAETLEVEPASLNQYHAAEAIIYYTDTTVNLNPPKGSPNSCSQGKQCKIFNCPYLYYPPDQNRTCLTWNDAKTIDPNSNIEEVKGVAIERFYNFAFLGENGNTPWSVNGHHFLPPTVAAYAEWDKVEQNCGECSESSICECTYYDTIDTDNTDQVYQFVLTNIGNGAGWSHPIHLHGHSFYVMKMGFASYNSSTGKLIPDRGAYVVIRFKADNPGLWFFHCHIDLHNTNGMGMMINESPKYHKKVPKDFPRCKNISLLTVMDLILLHQHSSLACP